MGAKQPLDSPRRYWLIDSCAGLRFGICGGCRARGRTEAGTEEQGNVRKCKGEYPRGLWE